MEQIASFRVGCAAVVKRDGKVLLAKRAEGKAYPGHWELPGGKLEEGEQPEDCARRELEEEAGLKAKSLRLVDAVQGDYEAIGSWVSLFYDCECEGEPRDLEPEAREPWQWFSFDCLPEPLAPWVAKHFKTGKPRIIKLSKNRLHE